MHWKRARFILGDLKKSVSWVLWSEEEGWLSLARSGGADGKARIEILCFFPYVEKPFSTKVIKSFVSELRNRKCFSCFGIPMFYVYMLWTFYVRFTYPYHGYVTHLNQDFSKYWKNIQVCRKSKKTNDRVNSKREQKISLERDMEIERI